MPDISTTWIGILLLVIFVVELATFWAAASLAEVPPLGWGKLLLTVILVTVCWLLLLLGLGWVTGIAEAPFAPDYQNTTYAVLGSTVVGLWLVPALLYVPLVPVTLRRGLLVSIFQFLLRAFLYVLIVAVTMLVLAILQVYFGIDVRAEGPIPGPGPLGLLS